jgi:hypothetical protein
LPGRKLNKEPKKSKDILTQDSTIVRLHSSSAGKFPAVRSRTVTAGGDVEVIVSVLTNRPKAVALL